MAPPPALGASEVELEPRPHTLPAASVALLEVSKEDLLAMSEHDLVRFAYDNLGVVLDSTWPRTKLLDRLMGFVVEVVEY